MTWSTGNRASRELGYCPCCGYEVFPEGAPGSAEVCPVCFWVDDIDQFEDPEHVGAANRVSLQAARENFRDCGACDPSVVGHTRPPDEERDPNYPYTDSAARR
jgi:hypothetical protein